MGFSVSVMFLFTFSVMHSVTIPVNVEVSTTFSVMETFSPSVSSVRSLLASLPAAPGKGGVLVVEVRGSAGWGGGVARTTKAAWERKYARKAAMSRTSSKGHDRPWRVPFGHER